MIWREGPRFTQNLVPLRRWSVERYLWNGNHSWSGKLKNEETDWTKTAIWKPALHFSSVFVLSSWWWRNVGEKSVFTRRANTQTTHIQKLKMQLTALPLDSLLALKLGHGQHWHEPSYKVSKIFLKHCLRCSYFCGFHRGRKWVNFSLVFVIQSRSMSWFYRKCSNYLPWICKVTNSVTFVLFVSLLNV